MADAIERVRSSALPTPASLAALDPSTGGWPRVRDIAHLLAAASRAVDALPHVTCSRARVRQLRRSGGAWELRCGSGGGGGGGGGSGGDRVAARCDAVVLCCGSSPSPMLDARLARSGVNVVPVEAALSEARTRAAVKPGERVAVVGNSHSAVLAVRNLVRCGSRREDVSVFVLEPLRFALWRGGGYQHTSRGIKGVAAAFAHEDGVRADSIFGRERPSHKLWPLIEGTPRRVEHVVPCVGFVRRPLPAVMVDDYAVDAASELRYDPKTARLLLRAEAQRTTLAEEGEGQGEREGEGQGEAGDAFSLPGLYEVGSGRPEYFTDDPRSGKPVMAFRGGAETEKEGWKGERAVAWPMFRFRAIDIVRQMTAAHAAAEGARNSAAAAAVAAAEDPPPGTARL